MKVRAERRLVDRHCWLHQFAERREPRIEVVAADEKAHHLFVEPEATGEKGRIEVIRIADESYEAMANQRRVRDEVHAAGELVAGGPAEQIECQIHAGPSAGARHPADTRRGARIARSSSGASAMTMTPRSKSRGRTIAPAKSAAYQGARGGTKPSTGSATIGTERRAPASRARSRATSSSLMCSPLNGSRVPPAPYAASAAAIARARARRATFIRRPHSHWRQASAIARDVSTVVAVNRYIRSSLLGSSSDGMVP